MHGILSYEEIVRVQRANDIRPKNECAPCAGGCTVTEDEELKGKTYADAAAMPQPLRRVCPHPKVIVPVTGVLMVKEPVKTHTPEMGEAKWRVADFNKCDARNQGLYAIPNDATVEHAKTEVKATTRVVDNTFDHPFDAKVIVADIKAAEGTPQPEATNAKEAEPAQGTDNGLALVKVEELGQEED